MCKAKAVAGRSAASGGVARLTPVPTASHRPPAGCGPDSTRMPAAFLPAIIGSFGHFRLIRVGGT